MVTAAASQTNALSSVPSLVTAYGSLLPEMRETAPLSAAGKEVPLGTVVELRSDPLELRAKSRHKKPENVKRYFKPFPQAMRELASLLAPGPTGADQRAASRSGPVARSSMAPVFNWLPGERSQPDRDWL